MTSGGAAGGAAEFPPPPQGSRWYFAYGSNMFTRRMRERVPSAIAIGAAELQGWRLAFDKVSADGSAKCNIEATDDPSDRVYGVLYAIASGEKAALDRAEGLGHGYAEGVVRPRLQGHRYEAIAFIATNTDPTLTPYDWYKALVLAGATEHYLPQAYVARLRRVPAIQDPDETRRRRNEALLPPP